MKEKILRKIIPSLTIAIGLMFVTNLSAQKELKEKGKEGKKIAEELKKEKPDRTGKPENKEKPIKSDKEDKSKESKDKTKKDNKSENSNKAGKLKGAERKIERLKAIATKLESNGKTDQAAKIRAQIKKAESILEEKKNDLNEDTIDDSSETVEEEK